MFHCPITQFLPVVDVIIIIFLKKCNVVKVGSEGLLDFFPLSGQSLLIIKILFLM